METLKKNGHIKTGGERLDGMDNVVRGRADRSKWDRGLIGRGYYFLEKASTGNELSECHLEVGVASLRGPDL